METRSFDSAFDRLTLGIARVERLWTGGTWLEGPVYFRDSRQLLWSDIPKSRIMRMTEEGNADVFRQPSGHACHTGNRVQR